MVLILVVIIYFMIMFGVFCELMEQFSECKTKLDKRLIAFICVCWPVLIGIKLAEILSRVNDE